MIESGVRMQPAARASSMQHEPRAPTSLPVLVAALTIGHTMASMALLTLPAVAPAVARDYAIDASLIGYQISMVSAGLLVALLLVGNLSRKLGGCRTNQLGHGLVMTGMLFMLLPSVIFLIPGSLAIGLGFALLAPSASYLLTRFTPAERRNLVFSIQQTSVPLGGILAATVAPIIAVTIGWRWSLALNACLLLAVIVMLQRGRRAWDDDRDPASPAVTRNPFASFVANWRDRRLRLLSIAGGAFCWAQFCVASYTVVTCVESLGMTLIVAGTVLTVVQLSSAAGRVIGGWVADRLKSAPRVLEWMGWTMLVCSIASIWLAPSWPAPIVYVLFALHGMASGAWAGILLAEFGHLAPKGQVSAVISGALFYVNTGKFVGPIVFAATYAFTHSYGSAFASVAIPAVAALCCLKAVRRK
jgi:MFS family permease